MKKTNESTSEFNIFDILKISRDSIINDIELDLKKTLGSDFKLKKYDPIYTLFSVLAYREMIIRSEVNKVSQKFLEDLEQANNKKLLPLGLIERYSDGAKEIEDVRDARAFKGVFQKIHVYVWPEKGSREAVERVSKHLDGLRLVNDEIEVSEAVEVKINIQAKVRSFPGAVVDTNACKESIIQGIESISLVSLRVSLSYIHSLAHTTGVQSVNILNHEELEKTLFSLGNNTVPRPGKIEVSE